LGVEDYKDSSYQRTAKEGDDDFCPIARVNGQAIPASKSQGVQVSRKTTGPFRDFGIAPLRSEMVFDKGGRRPDSSRLGQQSGHPAPGMPRTSFLFGMTHSR